ncbi:MAG TPA: TIGR01777 family oxidoreductase [Chitinophagaceae bacterium]|nr:TIGR01777 family oxidoreductase [Chitinophagaceae bacterium]
MQTILITGGTGLVGTALTKLLLEKKYDVIVLTRQKPELGESTPGIQYSEWNVEKQTIEEEAIKRADHIIHLAGANIAEKRWSESRKREIANSRTSSSALLVKALKEIPNKVRTVVSASAIGWYGEDTPNGKSFKEDDPPAPGFLGESCKAWEESLEPVKQLGKRLVKLRTGIVLSNRGGALPEFRRPLKFGMASILGSGKQMVSWIHIEDLCRMYCFAIEHQQLEEATNAVSPHPVSNKNLVLELAKKSKGNFFIPLHVPSFVLKIVLGEMSIEVLKSTTVSNQKIKQAGFKYLFPTLDAALTHLIKQSEV